MAPLTADMARRLLAAEKAARAAEAALEEAAQKRDKLRARYLERVPLSDKDDEKAKGIRATKISGIRIRIAPSISAERMSLKRYREAGHEITPAMQEAISPGRPYNRWTVKPSTS